MQLGNCLSHKRAARRARPCPVRGFLSSVRGSPADRGAPFPPAPPRGFSGLSRRGHRRPPCSARPSGGRPDCPREPGRVIGHQREPRGQCGSRPPRARGWRLALVGAALQARARQGCGDRWAGSHWPALRRRALRGGARTPERGCCGRPGCPEEGRVLSAQALERSRPRPSDRGLGLPSADEESASHVKQPGWPKGSRVVSPDSVHATGLPAGTPLLSGRCHGTGAERWGPRARRGGC